MFAFCVLSSMLFAGCGQTADSAEEMNIDVSDGTDSAEITVVDDTDTSTEEVIDEEVISEDEVIEDEPIAEEPAPTDYFSQNGLTIHGAGDFTYAGTAYYVDTEGNASLRDVQRTGHFTSNEISNSDGTKTLSLNLSQNMYDFGDGAWGYRHVIGFADKYTGKSLILNSLAGKSIDLVVEYEGITYNIVLSYEKDYGEGEDAMLFDSVSITCPTDYNGALIWVTGAGNNNQDDVIALIDKDHTVADINHDVYDLMFFGVGGI